MQKETENLGCNGRQPQKEKQPQYESQPSRYDNLGFQDIHFDEEN